MEIDGSLRIVQDFARQFGVPTPTQDAVVGLVILRARLAGYYPPLVYRDLSWQRGTRTAPALPEDSQPSITPLRPDES